MSKQAIELLEEGVNHKALKPDGKLPRYIDSKEQLLIKYISKPSPCSRQRRSQIFLKFLNR